MTRSVEFTSDEEGHRITVSDANGVQGELRFTSAEAPAIFAAVRMSAVYRDDFAEAQYRAIVTAEAAVAKVTEAAKVLADAAGLIAEMRAAMTRAT